MARLTTVHDAHARAAPLTHSATSPTADSIHEVIRPSIRRSLRKLQRTQCDALGGAKLRLFEPSLDLAELVGCVATAAADGGHALKPYGKFVSRVRALLDLQEVACVVDRARQVVDGKRKRRRMQIR